jgi:hypothetical protein
VAVRWAQGGNGLIAPRERRPTSESGIRRNRVVGAIALAAVLVAAGPLCAHDLWIEPSTFHPSEGETVAVGLRVGQNFIGDPVPRFSRAIEQFVVRQGGNEQVISGVENTDPAGWLRADGTGTAMIVYRSEPSFIELPA